MKISNLVLGSSLAVNVIIVAGFMFDTSDRPSSAALRQTMPVTASAAGPDRAEPHASAESTWAALQTNDLARQRDRLRAEGFPPRLIREILFAQLNEGFAERRRALEAARGDIPFWKNTTMDPQTMAALRAIDRENLKTLTELLGPDPDNGTAANLHRQFPDLAADKVAQLAAIRDDYEFKRSEVYANRISTLAPADREKLTALDAAQRAEIAATLTPQELEDYDLRTSNTARNLRSNLATLDITEHEFRTIFQLQQAFDNQFNLSNGLLPPDGMQARDLAQKDLNDQLKAALGDDRYEEYQRAMSYNYQQTTALVARLALPPETANQVWDVQKDIQQRLAVLRGQPLSAAQRTQQIAVLNDEATSKITAALGERGFSAYRQYGGSWMQSLQPPRPAPVGSTPGAVRQ